MKGMKRLVLLGEGHGEIAALPVLARKILQDAGAIDTEELADEWRRTNSQPQTFRAG